MNSKECSSYTTETMDDILPLRGQRVPDEKIVELLKLFYYEKTRVKQASKYLNINYTSAKKILREFRKGKLHLEGTYENEFEDILSNVHIKTNDREASPLGSEDFIRNSTVKKAYVDVVKAIQSLHKTLSELKEEVFANQLKIQALLGSMLITAGKTGKTH